jgi:elongation factor Ts
MYKVTIYDINQLRKLTGYGVMDCKRALIYSKGNIDKSIEILRKKVEKISIINNNVYGVVIATTNKFNNIGSIIKLNCETDFVSTNKEFIKFAYQLLEKSIYVSSLEELLLLKIKKNVSVDKKIIENSVIFGEQITLSDFKKIQAPFISSYVHHNYKIASLVGFSSFNNIGKNIAMQVAAMKPIALDEKNISYDIIQKEINYIKNNEKKINSKFILDKIIKGKLKKFIIDNTLMNQSYIKDNNISVRDYIKSYDSNLNILDFKIIAI